MRKRSRFGLFCVTAVLLPATALYADATFKILATKHNPTCGRRGSPHFGERCGVNSECDSTLDQGDGLCIGGIIPTNTLNVAVGDTIVAEVFISDWSPNQTSNEQIRTYQFKIALSTFFDGCPGGISGYRWNRLEKCDVCPPDGICTVEGEVCHPTGPCYPPDHEPELGLFIDTERLDYVFNGFSGIIEAFDACTLTFGALLIQQPGPLNDGTPRYAGTMVLSVTDGASGEYQVAFADVDEIGNFETFVADFAATRMAPFTLEPLTLIVPGDTCVIVEGCTPDFAEPSHCGIDARQTSQPDGSLLPGSESMAITFVNTTEDPCEGIVMGPDDFTVRQVPTDTPPAISSVDWDDVTKTATINFDRRISPQEWTCVSYIGQDPNTEFCTGSLPADVDANGTANASDILKVIDNLNGQVDPPYPIWQCDVDRSGVCGASDILRVIDLLNGASVYDVWLGQTIETCPDPAP